MLILELNPEHTVEGNEEERFHPIQKEKHFPVIVRGKRKTSLSEGLPATWNLTGHDESSHQDECRVREY